MYLCYRSLHSTFAKVEVRIMLSLYGTGDFFTDGQDIATPIHHKNFGGFNYVDRG